MKRRDVIALFGVAAAWPLAAFAQQSERMRRIGVLSSLAETDDEAQAWDAAFRKRLVELGWIDGRSIRIDYRWGAGSIDRMRLFARELVQLNPDALVTISTPATAALQAENSHNSDCICLGVRSGWQRICFKPGPSRWKHHRLPQY